MKKLLPAAILVCFTLAGCSSLIDAMAENAADALFSEMTGQDTSTASEPKGQETTAAARSSDEKQVTDNWSYEMEMEAQFVFTFAFTAGGFWISDAEYKEGEYTVFEWKIDDEEAVNMEKAFLKELDDGSQWWRVAWSQDKEAIVFEALLDPASGTIKRLRVRDSDGKTEDVALSGNALYAPAQNLDDGDVQIAGKGNVRVDTPAGAFQAKQLTFELGGSGRLEWWTTAKVPGSVVKYHFVGGDGSEIWAATLADYGKKTGSILGSF